MENPIKMDDLGVPPISGNLQMNCCLGLVVQAPAAGAGRKKPSESRGFPRRLPPGIANVSQSGCSLKKHIGSSDKPNLIPSGKLT